MVGKCIRKKDRSEFDYMMKVKKSIPVFYLNSGTWQYIGLQKDFENKFEFKDPINVSIILFCLESIMITDVLKNHLVKKVNSKDDQKEKNIAGWLCKRFGKVDVLCIQDLETFDISGVPHISKSFKPDKKFVFKCYCGWVFYCYILKIGLFVSCTPEI